MLSIASHGHGVSLETAAERMPEATLSRVVATPYEAPPRGRPGPVSYVLPSKLYAPDGKCFVKLHDGRMVSSIEHNNTELASFLLPDGGVSYTNLSRPSHQQSHPASFACDASFVASNGMVISLPNSIHRGVAQIRISDYTQNISKLLSIPATSLNQPNGPFGRLIEVPDGRVFSTPNNVNRSIVIDTHVGTVTYFGQYSARAMPSCQRAKACRLNAKALPIRLCAQLAGLCIICATLCIHVSAARNSKPACAGFFFDAT